MVAARTDIDTLPALAAKVGKSIVARNLVLRVPVMAGVVDWTLPMLGTEKLLEVLRAQSSPPRIVVYSHNEGGDIPRHAMAAGAADSDRCGARGERRGCQRSLLAGCGTQDLPLLWTA